MRVYAYHLCKCIFTCACVCVCVCVCVLWAKPKFRVRTEPADLSAHRNAIAEWRRGRQCAQASGGASKSFTQRLEETHQVLPLLQAFLPTIQRETAAHDSTCVALDPFDILVERKRVLILEQRCVRV